MGLEHAIGDVLRLESATVALAMAPHFGARIITLTDKRTGRNWLVPGALDGARDDDASYLAPQARGWDECYPTVGRCEAPHWGRTLRDHGDLWGRPWRCSQSNNTLSATYCGGEIEFTRHLELNDDNLVGTYEIKNTSNNELPGLWSQHCLLACRPGETLALDGIVALTRGGQNVDLDDVDGVDFTRVHDIEKGVALKAYGAVESRARIRIAGEGGGIEFSWSASDAPYLGLWLDYGGWPADAPVHQIAVEPTTSPTDDLAGALAGGHALWLTPGEHRHWQTTITLTPQ